MTPIKLSLPHKAEADRFIMKHTNTITVLQKNWQQIVTVTADCILSQTPTISYTDKK